MLTRNKKSIFSHLTGFAIRIIFFAVSLLGLFLLPKLSIQPQPSRHVRSVMVTFTWPKASARIIEKEVTSKVEALITTVRGVKRTRSVSGPGTGNITADIDERFSESKIRLQISQLISQIYQKLPQGVSYPVSSINNISESEKIERPLMTLTVSSAYSLSRLKEVVDTRLRGTLSDLQGVTQINVRGADNTVTNLNYSAGRAAIFGLTPDQIVNRANSMYKVFDLGQNYRVVGSDHTILIPATPKRPEDMALKSVEGRLIRFSDIGKAISGEQEASSTYRVNGEQTISVEVQAGPDENLTVLAGQIRSVLDEFQESFRGAVKVRVSYDASAPISGAISDMFRRTLIGLGLLFIFLAIVKRDWRYILIMLISAISNLAIAFIFYVAFHIDIHPYSLAALTLSFGILLDNTIVVIDHISLRNNLKILLAVVGTSAAMISSFTVLFALSDQEQNKIIDFAKVVSVNLAVSILVSLFLVPALMDKFGMTLTTQPASFSRRRGVLKFNMRYLRFIFLVRRYKLVIILIILFGIGLPVRLLPEKTEGRGFWIRQYNDLRERPFVTNTFIPWFGRIAGGTFNRFAAKSSLFRYNESAADPTTITLIMQMPEGSPIAELNSTVKSWEAFLKPQRGLKLFETWIYNGQHAMIKMQMKDNLREEYLYALKKQLERKGQAAGVCETMFYGAGKGFSTLTDNQTSSFVTIRGYNYDKVLAFGQLAYEQMLRNPRIVNASIDPEQGSNHTAPESSYLISIGNYETFLNQGLSRQSVISGLANLDASINNVQVYEQNGKRLLFRLIPDQRMSGIWQTIHSPLADTSGFTRLNKLGTLNKQDVAKQVVKEDQQYQIFVNYTFLGDYFLAKEMEKTFLSSLRRDMPLGYTTSAQEGNFWQKGSEKRFLLIIMALTAIFIVCAILLNSFRQATALVLMVPVSFIGIFLAGIFFDFNFDEGGYAAMLVLAGSVVSAGLYILNDYNLLTKDQPCREHLSIYLRAVNAKFLPIIISRTSIVLPLLPFLVQDNQMPFWYAMAISLTGGLVISIPALFLLMPLMLPDRVRKSEQTLLNDLA
jgi:multidrug efflux pump subunit AcrB